MTSQCDCRACHSVRLTRKGDRRVGSRYSHAGFTKATTDDNLNLLGTPTKDTDTMRNYTTMRDRKRVKQLNKTLREICRKKKPELDIEHAGIMRMTDTITCRCMVHDHRFNCRAYEITSDQRRYLCDQCRES